MAQVQKENAERLEKEEQARLARQRQRDKARLEKIEKKVWQEVFQSRHGSVPHAILLAAFFV